MVEETAKNPRAATLEESTEIKCREAINSLWRESTVPFSINIKKASRIRLFENPHALWIPLTHGGEVEFHIYRTYVLVESTVLSKAQLIAEVNTETPAGG